MSANKIVVLDDNQVLALASVLNNLTPSQASIALANDRALAAFIAARMKVSKVADDIIHRDRVMRRG
jgi:hypothetical protein